MKTSRSGAGGAFPSYDDFSEDDKRSNGINSVIAKYFAPTGLLALLILRSVVAPATPGGAATPHSDTMIETDALDTLDHFLSEVSVICDDNIISDLSVSLVRVS
jgi:hypothetical protein